jgi:hypothetical protein
MEIFSKTISHVCVESMCLPLELAWWYQSGLASSRLLTTPLLCAALIHSCGMLVPDAVLVPASAGNSLLQQSCFGRKLAFTTTALAK